MKNPKLMLAVCIFALLLAARPVRAQVAVIQAGEAGIQFVWQPNAVDAAAPVSLTGLTVTMHYAIQGSTPAVANCTVALDGKTASYTITSGNFANAGTYSVQFNAQTVDGAIIRKSPVKMIVVKPNL